VTTFLTSPTASLALPRQAAGSPYSYGAKFRFLGDKATDAYVYLI